MGFDTSVICPVFMHCFGSFILQAMFLGLQVFAFKGQKYENKREDVVYWHFTL